MGEPAAGRHRGSLRAGGRRRVLVVLCVTEITSWGTLYYAFPVLAPSIARDTGWSIPTVTAALSLGLVVAALVGIPVGRRLDRAGPRWLMTAGSVIGVPALLGVAAARSVPAFFAAWALAGIAMSTTLYPPAFAALTRWWGSRRVTALTALTLFAGLASTVFAPLSATLLAHLGWRQTYVALAVILAVITVPAHLFGLRGPWPDPEPATADLDRQTPSTTARGRPFVLLAIAIGLGAFTAFAVVVNQVPLLLDRGCYSVCSPDPSRC
jgi:MFS family permease